MGVTGVVILVVLALLKHTLLAAGAAGVVVKQYPVTPLLSLALAVKDSWPLLGALTATPEMLGAVVSAASPPAPPPPQADKTNKPMAEIDNVFKRMVVPKN